MTGVFYVPLQLLRSVTDTEYDLQSAHKVNSGEEKVCVLSLNRRLAVYFGQISLDSDSVISKSELCENVKSNLP